MSNLTTFSFDSNELRVVQLDGEPWFVAKDVCIVLGYNVKANGEVNTTNALRPLGADEVTTARISSKGNPPKLISESGLYKLVLRSDKPQAKPFQDWVTKTVLPAIRKDGSFTQGNQESSTTAEEVKVGSRRAASPPQRLSLLNQWSRDNDLFEFQSCKPTHR